MPAFALLLLKIGDRWLAVFSHRCRCYRCRWLDVDLAVAPDRSDGWSSFAFCRGGQPAGARGDSGRLGHWLGVGAQMAPRVAKGGRAVARAAEAGA